MSNTDTTVDRRAFMAYFSSHRARYARSSRACSWAPGATAAGTRDHERDDRRRRDRSPDSSSPTRSARRWPHGLQHDARRRSGAAQGTARHEHASRRSSSTRSRRARSCAKKTKAPMRAQPRCRSWRGRAASTSWRTQPVTQLSELVRTRKVKPSELTDMYLSRLKRYDPQLHFVINLTEERARKQATRPRRRDRARPLSRSAARHPLGREGSARRERLSHDVGRRALSGSRVRLRRDRREAPRRRRRRSRRQAHARRRSRREIIWWKERTRNPWNPEQPGRAARRPARRRRRPPDASASASARRRTARSRRPRARAALRDSVRRSAACRAPARWRSRGRPTSSARSAAAPKTARSSSTRFKDPTAIDYSVKEYPFNWNASVKASQLRIAYFK